MNKQTQLIIGLVAVAGIGYYLWKSGQKPQGFANAVGKGIFGKMPKTINFIAGGIGRDGNGENAQWISYGGAGTSGYWYPCESPRHPRPCYPVGTVLPGVMQ